MTNINKFKETLDLCNGAHNKKDVQGWNTLNEFNNSSPNKDFDARVYKQGNRVVIAFAGTYINRKNDKLNDLAIFNPLNHIPSQFGDAERLYNQVKTKYPNANIEFTGYSLGGSIANLMSHRTGLPSNALAPVGSEHIAKTYPKYFPYKGENITTYGRNPLTGSNHIYTREEVGEMSSDEFAKHEKEIDAQTRAFNGTMPTNGDLQQEAMTGGGVVYVNSYTHSDGTGVYLGHLNCN